MKCLALVFVVSLLAGCSTTPQYRLIENGDFYVGGGSSVIQHLSLSNPVRLVREAQIAGSDRALIGTSDVSSSHATSLQLVLGYQVAKALDLEATFFTSSVKPLAFSSWSFVDDLTIDGPPADRRHAVRNDGELSESGAMLTALTSWRFHKYFNVFARFGGSYDQTTLKSKLTRDRTNEFISEVTYRTKDILPVWGVGMTVTDAFRVEYLARKVPLGSTASDLRTGSGGSFAAADIGGKETLHSLMITLRLGLKMFGDNTRNNP